MTAHKNTPPITVGEKVKVYYVDDRIYALDVEVTAIRAPDEFIGRVEAIFISSAGEMLTGGQTFDGLMGQERKFSTADILARDARRKT